MNNRACPAKMLQSLQQVPEYIQAILILGYGVPQAKNVLTISPERGQHVNSNAIVQKNYGGPAYSYPILRYVWLVI